MRTLSPAPRRSPPIFGWGAIARLVTLVACLCFIQPAAQAQPGSALPDENTMARLVWTSLITLDNANRTGNYAVLHALGTPQFQQLNPPETLAGIFGELRGRRVDIGRVLLASPTYYDPPAMIEPGLLRLRGGFEFRPQSVRFDLVFMLVDGGWRLHGISVAETRFDAPRR